MRLRIILVFFFALCTTLAENAFAQPDTTAIVTAKARILSPITVTQTGNLAFGNCRMNAGSGSVTVAASNGARSTSGNVGTNNGQPVHEATFTVTGEPGLTFSVTLPSTHEYSSTISITNFTQYATTYTLDNSGNGSFKVGGRLNLPSTANSFVNYFINPQVTVNYQ